MGGDARSFYSAKTAEFPVVQIFFVNFSDNPISVGFVYNFAVKPPA